MDETDILELIWDIVTGDGAQLENLAMDASEWRTEAKTLTTDLAHFPITMHFDNWLKLVSIAKAYDERR